MALFDSKPEADAILELQSNIREIVEEVKRQSYMLSDLLRRHKGASRESDQIQSDLRDATDRILIIESKLGVLISKSNVTVHNVNGDVDGSVNIAGGDNEKT